MSDVHRSELMEALRQLRADNETKERGPGEAHGGGSFRLNVRLAASFVFQLVKLKGKVSGADPDIMSLGDDVLSIMATGLTMLRVQLSKPQFVILSLLGTRSDGLTLEEVAERYEPFIEEWTDASVLERFWTLGVTTRYLEAARVANPASFPQVLDSLVTGDFAKKVGDRFAASERRITLGFSER